MRTFLATAATLALAAPGFAPEHPRFQPRAGARVTKTFTSEIAMELEKTQVWFDDEEMPDDEYPFELNVESRDEVVFVDRYVEVGEGRPEQLERLFESASSKSAEHAHSEENDSDHETERESELAGLTVTFTWDDESEEFVAAFKDKAGDAAWLEGLREDADLRRFLPSAAVEEGATWEVELLAFDDLISPGGDLVMKAEDGDERDVDEDELRENLEGKVSAKYAGRREVDGVQVDVIELEVDVRTHGDVEEDEDSEGGESTRAFEIEQKLSGELLWATELGHAHSLVLEGRAKYTMTVEATYETDDGEAKFKQRMEFAGTARHEVKFVPVDEE